MWHACACAYPTRINLTIATVLLTLCTSLMDMIMSV